MVAWEMCLFCFCVVIIAQSGNFICCVQYFGYVAFSAQVTDVGLVQVDSLARTVFVR